MLTVQVRDDDINIVFSRNLISDRDLMEFIERIRAKHLIAESKLTEEQARDLDDQLKADWWGKNKDKFISKIQ